MTNSFDFKLLAQNGIAIPKTSRGKAVSGGPKSRTDLGANPFVRRVGASPGGVVAMDFPKLTDLFIFPSNGIYLFEMRYWTWNHEKKRFVLSPPARMRITMNAER